MPGPRARLHPGGMGSSPGVQGVMTDAGTGSRARTGGWEGRRLLQSRPAPAQPASSAHTPSRPVSHQLRQTSKGNWERTVRGGGGKARDTPSFLLVTASNFQHILQALVVPEVILPFLSTGSLRQGARWAPGGRQVGSPGCRPSPVLTPPGLLNTSALGPELAVALGLRQDTLCLECQLRGCATWGRSLHHSGSQLPYSETR